MRSDLPGILFDRESIRVFVPQKRPCTYRLYNEAGELVYAGASASPRSRLLEHVRDGKPATVIRLEFHGSTTAMARAEKLMLETEPTLIPAGFGRRHATWRAR